jgi:hypothetical protein
MPDHNCRECRSLHSSDQLSPSAAFPAEAIQINLATVYEPRSSRTEFHGMSTSVRIRIAVHWVWLLIGSPLITLRVGI